jgi:hypothetical protein
MELTNMLKDIGFFALTTIIAVVGWFLKQKDETQGKQISSLWEKHDEDVRMLASLKERVDREYYAKGELDTRINGLRQEVHEGFRKVEDKIDKLIDAMMVCTANKKP